ncbi:glycosyltransferase family 1 protein [Chloroflexus sp. Y-396-1]|uniref:glycosyltransferase family 4 protein n=1 Tax=Chloroflexus sp. Y-396-1 TaxID=867845 RepID=UPI0004917DDD|nr:glycosyltransferase family 1 protein [Chloroflexus sp. Y-396-1]
MRIGIDVRYLSHGLVGGVHTYVKHFVAELCTIATDHQIFLYADTKCPFELDNLPPTVTLRLLPYRGPQSSVYLDYIGMRRAMARDRLDVVHYPANYGFRVTGARVVVTLHDALTIMPLSETLFSSGSRRTLRSMATTIYLYLASRRMLHHADLLLTVSEHAKQDILRYCRFDPQRIIPIPHAPTSDMHRIGDETILAAVRRRYGIDRPFVLADALKNPGVLVRAWRRLPASLRQSHRIIFFSRHPEPLPIVFEAVERDDALLLINPPRPDLIALYSMAEVFVFPSWFEGFGIPVLEAMTCGAPVIVSDRGPLPEVAGGAALVMDAEDDTTLAGYLERLLTNPAEITYWRERGFARAARFSWRKTAQRILESYEQALHTAIYAPGVL